MDHLQQECSESQLRQLEIVEQLYGAVLELGAQQQPREDAVSIEGLSPSPVPDATSLPVAGVESAGQVSQWAPLLTPAENSTIPEGLTVQNTTLGQESGSTPACGL